MKHVSAATTGPNINWRKLKFQPAKKKSGNLPWWSITWKIAPSQIKAREA